MQSAKGWQKVLPSHRRGAKIRLFFLHAVLNPPRLDMIDLIDSLSATYSTMEPSTRVAYISNRGFVVFTSFDAQSRTIHVKRGEDDIPIALDSLASLARELEKGLPIHVDTFYSSGSNTRTIHETLVAHLPEGGFKMVDGRKHLMAFPFELHDMGKLFNLDGNDWTNPEWALAIVIYADVVMKSGVKTIPARIGKLLENTTRRTADSWQARIHNLSAAVSGGGFNGGDATEERSKIWLTRIQNDRDAVRALAPHAFQAQPLNDDAKDLCQLLNLPLPPEQQGEIGAIGLIGASILAKPFVIVTGNSGTGKTMEATRLAGTYRDHDDPMQARNLSLVAVGADWTDNRSVVGFVNYLREIEVNGKNAPVYQSTPVLDLLLHADHFPNTPHFLILDEMNLSHVERYFSDFLSAMEAENGMIKLHSEVSNDDAAIRLPRFVGDMFGVPARLKYPENLFIVGTVNVDETTYMFSPKVLDRAHVIEHTVARSELKGYLGEPSSPPPVMRASKAQSAAFLKLSRRARGLDGEALPALPEGVSVKVNEHLLDVFDLLSASRFEFAFRTAKEVNSFMRVRRATASDVSEWDNGAWVGDLDHAFLQKILPRLHGSRARIESLLGAIGAYFHFGNKAAVSSFLPKSGSEIAERSLHDLIGLTPEKSRFQKSFRKIALMSRVVIDEQFVSFIC